MKEFIIGYLLTILPILFGIMCASASIYFLRMAFFPYQMKENEGYFVDNLKEIKKQLKTPTEK